MGLIHSYFLWDTSNSLSLSISFSHIISMCPSSFLSLSSFISLSLLFHPLQQSRGPRVSPPTLSPPPPNSWGGKTNSPANPLTNGPVLNPGGSVTASPQQKVTVLANNGNTLSSYSTPAANLTKRPNSHYTWVGLRSFIPFQPQTKLYYQSLIVFFFVFFFVYMWLCVCVYTCLGVLWYFRFVSVNFAMCFNIIFSYFY